MVTWFDEIITPHEQYELARNQAFLAWVIMWSDKTIQRFCDRIKELG